MTADQLYHSLHVLQLGDVVPDAVYVLDYEDGQCPAWCVVEREALGADGVRLVLHDRGNGDMFNCVQLVVLTFPQKTLRTGPHLDGGDMPGRLCDLAQQGRHARKRGWRWLNRNLACNFSSAATAPKCKASTRISPATGCTRPHIGPSGCSTRARSVACSTVAPSQTHLSAA